MPKPTPPHSLLHHESLGNTNMKPTYAAALKKPEGNTDSEQAAKKQKTSADGFGSEQHAFAPSTATWVKNAGALKDKIVAATTPKKEKKHKKEKHAKGHKLDQPEKMKESKEIFEAKPLPPIPKDSTSNVNSPKPDANAEASDFDISLELTPQYRGKKRKADERSITTPAPVRASLEKLNGLTAPAMTPAQIEAALNALSQAEAAVRSLNSPLTTPSHLSLSSALYPLPSYATSTYSKRKFASPQDELEALEETIDDLKKELKEARKQRARLKVKINSMEMGGKPRTAASLKGGPSQGSLRGMEPILPPGVVEGKESEGSDDGGEEKRVKKAKKMGN